MSGIREATDRRTKEGITRTARLAITIRIGSTARRNRTGPAPIAFQL